MSTRALPGANQPKAEVRRAAPVINMAAAEALTLLRSTEQMKAFCGELIEALESLTPAEPDNPGFTARRRQAIDAWNRLKDKETPEPLDYVPMLEHTLAAAIATQKAPDKAAPKESAAAFSPQALGNIYARRRGAAK